MKCIIENCEGQIFCKQAQLCSKHYNRKLRHGSTDKRKVRREILLEQGKSYCSKCKEVKSVLEFTRDSYTYIGLSAYCKNCNKDKNRLAYINNKDIYRSKNLYYKFGITLEEYEVILFKQDGKCAICRSTFKNKMLAVDHCHQTGKIRGLLCHLCNISLGGFKDDIKLLKLAINYLKQYE